MKTCLYLQVYNENPTEVGVHGGGTIYIYIYICRAQLSPSLFLIKTTQTCFLLHVLADEGLFARGCMHFETYGLAGGGLE